MMWVVATARYGLAAGLLYAVLLTGLQTYAEEPKTAPPKPTEQPKEKPAEQSKEPSKASDKTLEPKGADVKGPVPMPPPPPKATDTKPAKPAEQPKEQSKSSDKAPESKGSETKGGGPSESTPNPKAADAKPPEPKLPPTPIVSIKLALMADPRLFPYEINVDMNGDVATLTGKVGSEAEKGAATDIAQASEGVKSVTNNLEIAKDLPQVLARKKDELITQYVKDRFGKSKTLESAHFDVKTEDGIVQVSGKTKFLVIALEAAEAARQVPGVKAVRSEGIRVEGAE
ncbi:MAG: BON domain-containing protein [Nitrospirales bacterium]|nr:BON domain-containing protein [Nitrospirales bacterium]